MSRTVLAAFLGISAISLLGCSSSHVAMEESDVEARPASATLEPDQDQVERARVWYGDETLGQEQFLPANSDSQMH